MGGGMPLSVEMPLTLRTCRRVIPVLYDYKLSAQGDSIIESKYLRPEAVVPPISNIVIRRATQKNVAIFIRCIGGQFSFVRRDIDRTKKGICGPEFSISTKFQSYWNNVRNNVANTKTCLLLLLL